DCVRGFPEACRAWTILVAALVDRLRSAPRRGSLTPSREPSPNSTFSAPDSTRSLNCTGLRRDSTFRSSWNNIQHSTQDSLGTPGCPVRRNSYRGAASDMSGGCIDMTSLKAELPDVRSSPAIA
ncbi:hypothetical protein COOONC_17632, partial [Cooperia oncophora]